MKTSLGDGVCGNHDRTCHTASESNARRVLVTSETFAYAHIDW